MVLKPTAHRQSAIVAAVMLTAFISMHCGVTQPVRVLEKGSTQLSASLGGPIIKPAGFPMPVPYMTAGAVHGLTGDVSLIGRAHVTALLFGDLGLDAGAAYALAHERGIVPEITATGELYLFSDLRHGSATRGYPFLSLNASYVLTGSVLVFAGAEDVYQLRPARHFMTPFAGVEIPVSSRSVLQMEMKWMAANVNTAHGVFEGYSSIGGMGSFGTFFGCTYRW